MKHIFFKYSRLVEYDCNQWRLNTYIFFKMFAFKKYLGELNIIK